MTASPEHSTRSLATGAGRPRLVRAIVVVAVMVVCVAGVTGAELAARYYERHRTTPPDYFPSVYYPHRRLRYALIPSLDYYGWFRINSLGFRGREVSARKPPGVLRVVCLGGSTTFDIGSVGTARPWPEVLEADLRQRLGTESIEVLNLGISGAMSLDSLIDLQTRALALEPDLIVVYQGHNDFNYSLPGPAPAASTLFPSEVAPRSSLSRWVFTHSLLYAKGIARLEAFTGGVFARLRGLVAAEPSGDAVPVDRNEAIERGLADFRTNLTSIVAVARANRIPLVLPEVVLPFGEGPDSSCRVCQGLPAAMRGIDTATLRSVFNRYDGVLQDLAAHGEGVVHIPTAGFVPPADRYFHDPIHFGPEGSLRMGTRLGEALAPVLSRIRAYRPV